MQQLLGSIQQETIETDLSSLGPKKFSYIQSPNAASQATIRGKGIRVKTVAIAKTQWAWSTSKIAEEYGLSEAQVLEALAFYKVHQAEMEAEIAAEVALEAAHA